MLYELLNFGQSTNNKLRGLSDLMNLILYEMYYIHLKKKLFNDVVLYNKMLSSMFRAI